MGTLFLTGTASGAPTSARKKPVRALRGRRRHTVVKLMHYIQLTLDMDDRERMRAEAKNYVPWLFGIRRSANEYKALNLLLSRCEAALSATVQ